MSKKSGITSPLTIVIKLGTSSIVHEVTHQPLISLLSGVVETVVRLRANGHRVVLVSSGAIGVGLKRMNMPEKPRHLSGKQALAAVGQGRLIALWDNLFGQLEQPIAQVLLTRGDISDRTRYLNAVNTLMELLSMGVVPIINENDTISVSEIKFGDNDTLSAITSSMLKADYLFLLTDVEALYTSNPRKDPHAKAIDIVTSVANIRKQVSTATLGSSLGTGGMETKLIAAEIATGAGVAVIITSSKKPETIFDIIQYNAKSTLSLQEPVQLAPGENAPASPLLDRAAAIRGFITPTPSGTSTPIRPPHTLFKPSLTPMRDMKSWTSHTLFPAGSVIIDVGAHNVLSRRESGGRLLAAGVLDVEGKFASGQAVRIVVRRKKAMDVTILSSSSTTTAVAYAFEEDADGNTTPGGTSPTSLPSTPILHPSCSLSSSISSIDYLSRSASLNSFSEVANKVATVTTSATVTIPVSVAGASTVSSEVNDAESPNSLAVNEQESEWESVEVGRGLANYNSVDILKVKGVKSNQIGQILGYADSEHVVENITIRVPP